MTLAERLYRVTHRKAIAEGGSVPYYWKYSIFTIVAKPVRKFFSAVIIPTIPFSGIRVWAYRRCGYRIGKNAFIGMRCYLDDMCYDKIIIGNNVTISYGVYFACHGRKQGHNEIVIGDGAYIGMNASIVARTPIEIGKGAVVGACSLVNKSIAAGTTVAGIPAKSLKTRSINGGVILSDSHYIVYKHCLIWHGEPHDEPELTSRLARVLMKRHNAWMLRNCWNWDCGIETNFWEIICDGFCSIEELPSKCRNQIRRSLKDCEIRIISQKDLVEADGYRVFKDAFKRYRDVSVTIPSRKDWERAALNDRVHEYWGVFIRETNLLIAYAMNTLNKECVEYNTLKAIPEFMNRHYPYFGLLFEMNRHYMGVKGYRYVSDGWRSVTGHSGIQPFLEKNFKFRKAYTKMKLYYVSWFGLIVKILYPFRHFKMLPINVSNVLRFEEINRES